MDNIGWNVSTRYVYARNSFKNTEQNDFYSHLLQSSPFKRRITAGEYFM